ncbi:EfeM/EfeO family lipoprotein [Corynebacterium sp. ACRPH]|uniref:EfeM/EfeO family lipoprotein n=1 Tax=Corynebacterium sp. ACRPH TaxID=2918199 RepID=UPI001EF1FD61|nr:EfeM/EfeO family lipoprotein [Corynebacterium sp. ACRPH]MCG7456690.1 EfeM/EfeO family lipoprotein [Corynebacterium sp. ACRPH]
MTSPEPSDRPRPLRRPARVVAALAVASISASALLLSGCSSEDSGSGTGGGGGDGSGDTGLSVDADIHIKSRRACPSPGDLHGDLNHIRVANTADASTTVYVADQEGFAYQTLERVGSSATRSWSVKLADGTYHLTCVFQGKKAIASDEFRVTDSSLRDAPRMKPITDKEVTDVSIAHAHAQKPQVREWVSKDDALLRAVRSGDRAAAQEAWKTAYLAYRRLDDSNHEWPGPVDEIADFGTSSKANGAQAKDLSGYHRLEWGLWHGEPMGALVAPAEKLNQNVRKVADGTEHFAIFAPNYGLRTHEVTEEVERFDLKSHNDFGAHITGSAVRAALYSTRSTLDPLRELVEDRGADLQELDRQLDRTDKVAKKMAAKYDGKKPFTAWKQADQRELGAAIGELNELLAPLATMTVIRRM